MKTSYEQTATITATNGANAVAHVNRLGIRIDHLAMDGTDHDYAMTRALLIANLVRRARRLYFRMFGKRAP